jgi:hypothetical protein
MAKAKRHSSTKDPVYAEIEKHQKAIREFYQSLKVVPGTLSPDPKKEGKYGNRELRATDRLASTVPTTMHGLLALVTYVNAVSDGRDRVGNKRDNCFEESLFDVLASVEKLLAEQIGRAA